MAQIKEVTRLEWFLRTHGLKPKHAAKEAAISRQHLLRLRNGTMEPTRKVMVMIRRACARLTRKRVSMRDLFDIDTPKKRKVRYGKV